MFKFNTIVSKINFILFITVISVLSFSGFLTYSSYSSHLYEDLGAKVAQVEKRLTLILPSVIWDLQIQLAKDIVATEVADEDIDAIVIKDTDKSILVNVGKKTKLSISSGIIPIKFENKIVSTMVIYYNHHKIEHIKFCILKAIMIKISIILFLMLLAFNIFINKYIIKNIDELIKDIKSFTQNKNFDETIKINTNDELSYIADEFNNMKNSLKISWEQLNQLNNNLEQKVKDEVQKNKDIQEQLFKSEKLASMGEMIGNIAHQWRQPLSVISTSATGMQMQQEYGVITEDSINHACEAINDNAQYLSKTIDDFKNFIKGNRKKEQFNLKDSIDSFLHLLEGTIKANNIKLILDIKDDIEINGYSNEIIQCLINIFNNAKDALKEHNIDQKLVFVSTKKDDKFAYIEIKDNAKGIPTNILPKIFEPYFTTKHKSRGTGLGLHMTYNLIIKGMNGTIKAKNVTYKDNNIEYTGALFTIAIPL